MDLIEHFARLFSYDGWANLEALSSIGALESPPRRALELMAHVFAAEHLWMERLLQKPQSLPVWPEFTIEECEVHATGLPVLWANYLAQASEAELAKPVSYQNSKGETWSSRKDDILMHLVTHSAYHRGQVATTMRTAGFSPAYTDYIHSIRQGFVGAPANKNPLKQVP